jgi:hypothetical protein
MLKAIYQERNRASGQHCTIFDMIFALIGLAGRKIAILGQVSAGLNERRQEMSSLYELVEWEDLGYNIPCSLPYPHATTLTTQSLTSALLAGLLWL